jgi:glycosyltransferase involved in cell wall biosynthesis
MVKRVFFFRPTLGEGGADRVTLTLLQRLDRSRFAPTLVLMRAEGPFLADLPGDVRVIPLGSARLATAGRGLAALLRRERPDVLFSTASTSNLVAVAAHFAARSRARLVLSERNALYRGRRDDLKQRLEVALKKVTYRGADLVTAVSQGVADQLADSVRVPRDKLAVVYNPMVDDDLATRAAEVAGDPWFEQGTPVILACGRLVTQKDYPTLLDAFARVRARHPARLFVLGEGPMRTELEARARAAGLADCVRFHGFDKNPFKYMARARLLMHASRAEGLPGSLIQAMACGTPVVSTDCDFGPREVITRPGEDGYLVPVGDAAGLADRATALLTDDALRDRIAAEARRSAARFSVAASLARYQQAIEG